MTHQLGARVMSRAQKSNILYRSVLASALTPFLLMSCSQGNSTNHEQAQSVPVIKTVDVPTSKQARSKLNALGALSSEQSISEVLKFVAKHTQEIDVVPLRFDGRAKKAIQQGESFFTDELFAEEGRRRRLDGTMREYLLEWLSVETNFNHEINLRCAPGTKLGFEMYFDLEKADRIRMVADTQCLSVDFFDADGDAISRTSYIPSRDVAKPLLKKIFQK